MTVKTEDFSFIREAKSELVTAVCMMRQDWNPEQLDSALYGAKMAGWSWVRAAQAVWRLAMIRDSSPWDLTEEVRASIGYREPSGPTAEYRSGREAMDRAQGSGDDADAA